MTKSFSRGTSSIQSRHLIAYESLKTALKAGLVYLAIAALFSLLSISTPTGHVITAPYEDIPRLENPAGFTLWFLTSRHMLMHLALGVLVGILTLNLTYTMSCAAFSVFLDIDHLLSFLGYDVYGRPSHSVIFLLLINMVLPVLFRRNYKLGLGLSVVSVAAFLSHIAYDSVTSVAGFPLFYPVSELNVRVGDELALLLQTLGMLTAFGASKIRLPK